MLDRAHFTQWLDEYKRCWEAKDAAGFAALFSEECLYQWGPFGEAIQGRAGVAEAFRGATANQREITFSYRIRALSDQLGVCQWNTRLYSLRKAQYEEYDGVFFVTFDASTGLCALFEEWWNTRTHEADT